MRYVRGSSPLAEVFHLRISYAAPSKSRPACSHHLQDNLAPGLRADRSQRFRIGRVAIYCANVLCLLVMYFLIPMNPASTIAYSNGGYSQLPPTRLLGCLLVSRRATLCWKLPRARSILGVSTHVSAPNNNTACVTALKNCPDTFGSYPSRLNIRDNRPQLFLALWRLNTTAGQSSSIAVITRPRYLNAVTVSNGSP